MDITIIGWVWLGILVGAVAGFILSSLMAASKTGELEAELVHQRFVRDSLKEEIFRLENQSKPKPRKRRNIKAKSIKIGK